MSNREQVARLLKNAEATNGAGGHAEWQTFSDDSEEWLRGWVAEYCPEAVEKDKPNYDLLWEFPACPFDPSHIRGECCVGKKVGGGYFFRCPHNSGKGRGWAELRALKQPGWQAGRNGSAGGSGDNGDFGVRAEECEWDLPISFREFNLPPFPTYALPGWLERFVDALAVETQTPPDLAGLLSLAACAAALARKVKVAPRGGWEEPVNRHLKYSIPYPRIPVLGRNREHGIPLW